MKNELYLKRYFRISLTRSRHHELISYQCGIFASSQTDFSNTAFDTTYITMKMRDIEIFDLFCIRSCQGGSCKHIVLQ